MIILRVMLINRINLVENLKKAQLELIKIILMVFQLAFENVLFVILIDFSLYAIRQ